MAFRALPFAACLALFGGAAGGCGYRFQAGGAPLPEGIRTLSSPVFVNRTPEPGVEAIFTQALREQLARSGVQGGEVSDAKVFGEVLSLGGGPTLIASDGKLASYRITAWVRLRLVREERTLNEVTVVGSEDYVPARQYIPPTTGGGSFITVEGDVLLSEAQRGAAVRRLADTLMRDAYARLTTGF